MSSYLCRLCVVKIEPNLEDNDVEVDQDMYTKIQMHLHLNIKGNDISLSTVCTSCVDKINQFHDYYQKVHENQQNLIKYFNEMTELSQNYDSRNFETVNIEASKTFSSKYSQENNVEKNSQVTMEQEIDKLESMTNDTISDDYSEESKTDPFKSTDHNDVKNSQLNLRKSTLEKSKRPKNEEQMTKTSNSSKTSTKSKSKTKKTLKKVSNSDSSSSSESDENDNTDDEEQEEFNGEFPKVVIKDGKFLISSNKIKFYMQRFFVLVCDLCPPHVDDENDVTSSKFSTLSSLLSHYKNVHKEMGYITCCDKKIYRRHMAHHFAFHVNPEEYTCKECNHISRCPYTLKAHIKNKHFTKTNPNRENFPCPECGRVYQTPKSLKRHQMDKHPSEELQCKCKECGKSFNSEYSLRHHIKALHSDPKFVCDVCGKNFRMKSNLTAHIVSHESQKVQCEVCGIWLKNESIARTHFHRYHTSTVLLHCDECDYTTMVKRNLTKHKRLRHSTIKPYSCPYCDHKFKSKSNLTDHITQHTGVKTQCEFCPEEFITKSNYYSHRKKRHFEEIEKLNLQRQQELLQRNQKNAVVI